MSGHISGKISFQCIPTVSFYFSQLFKTFSRLFHFQLFINWQLLCISCEQLFAGSPSLGDGVHLGPALEQQDHNVHVAQPRGDMQRGLLLLQDQNLSRLAL